MQGNSVCEVEGGSVTVTDTGVAVFPSLILRRCIGDVFLHFKSEVQSDSLAL